MRKCAKLIDLCGSFSSYVEHCCGGECSWWMTHATRNEIMLWNHISVLWWIRNHQSSPLPRLPLFLFLGTLPPLEKIHRTGGGRVGGGAKLHIQMASIWTGWKKRVGIEDKERWSEPVSPGIDSEKSIPPSYVAWRSGTTSRVVVRARQAGNRFLGSLKGLQIRALVSGSLLNWGDTV